MISKWRLKQRCVQLVCVALLAQVCKGVDGAEKPKESAATTEKTRGDTDSPNKDGVADAGAEGKAPQTEQQSTDPKSKIDPKEMYQKLFRHKRQAHMDAIKSIIGMGNYEKQYKMLSILMEKLFTVMTESKVKLMESGFLPGDPFPTEEGVRDAYSSIAENTAFFGDILLHMPDMTHGILEYHRDWDVIIKWSIGFCNESKVYVGSDLKMLNLVAQELEIIERDVNYVNPYKAEAQRMEIQMEQEEMERKRLEKKKQKRKDKLDKKKRGPRLSGGRTEL